MSQVVRYRAIRATGEVVTGRIGAVDLTQARTRLRESGLTPIRLHESAPWFVARGRVPRRQWALLLRALASLLEAGMPLDRAIDSVRPMLGPRLAPTLDQIQRLVRQGSSLSDALDRSGTGPPRVGLGIIQAGERAGRLPAALDQAAIHLEHELELVGKLRQALAYPILLACVGSAAIAVISLVVLPRFAGLIEDAGQQLPVATRLLLSTTSLMTSVGWWWLAILGSACALGYAWWSRLENRRRVIRWLLSAPVIGPLLHALAGARVARALGGMLESGMPLLSALDVAASSAGNTEVESRIARSRERVARGEPLARALGREQALPQSILPLVALGEQTGQLAAMTLKAAALAAREAERTLTTLVAVLEPGMIVGFGGLVAFVAAALLQAVYALRPG